MTHLSSAALAGAGGAGHVDAGIVNVPSASPAAAPVPVVAAAMAGNAQHGDEGTVNKLIRSRRTERA
jgi:hypothetical protein